MLDRSTGARWCALALVALVLTPVALPAGDGVPRDPVVYMIHGDSNDQLGIHLVVVGDVDKDGVPDFAASVRDSQHGPEYPELAGRVDLYSGKSGSLLRTFWGEAKHEFLGERALNPFPDLDGDGVLELGASVSLVGTRVFSPVTGATWYVIGDVGDLGEPDAQFLIVSDLDGDGIPEVVSGTVARQPMPFLYRSGRVQCRSGKTGALIWTRWGTRYGGGMGRTLCLAGDHDGDHVPDVLTADIVQRSPHADRIHEFESVILILSGQNGAILRTVFPPRPRLFAFGLHMASIGDSDGDGFPEVAISAPNYRESDKEEYPPAPEFKEGGFFTGWVGVFKLPGFELLFSTQGRESTTLETHAGDKLGIELAPAGDVNGDGIVDFLAGTDRSTPGPSQQGRLYVFSGLNGEALATYEGYNQLPTYFFQTLSPLGDLDGDGRDEFLAANKDEIVYRNREQLFMAGTIRALRLDVESPRYIRGDADGDGRVTVADALAIARLATADFCHSGSPLPPNLPGCPAAHDVDADGCIDREDAIFLVTYLFKPFELAPAPPFPGCGQHYRLRVAEDSALRHLPCRDPGSCGE